MQNDMAPRERWLAAIQMKPVDRLPFWPKLDGTYPKAQVSPFNEMSGGELHDWIGSDRHVWIGSGTRDVRTNTKVEIVREGTISRTTHSTPTRELHSASQFDEKSSAWHPIEFPVKTREDILAMTDVYRDVEAELDTDALQRAQDRHQALGDDVLTACGIGESPLMKWVEYLAGVENAHYLLVDYREEVEALFEAMHDVLLSKARLVSEHSPSDVLYMVENTSTTLVSPDQYCTYCAAHVGAYADIASAAGRNLVLHMCGHLKELLPELNKIEAQAFEAFTSPTVGNTTLLDGRSACPEKCLIGGTNATLWARGADEIIAQIEHDLDELPHHRGIVVTSAGVMPPMCKPETIKRVCEWVKQYPARMN